MVQYADWLFYIPAILAVFFMIWVLLKFTEQLAGPEKAKKAAESESRYLHVVTAASARETRTPTRVS